MIDRRSTRCRHCETELSAAELDDAARRQEQVETAIAQANQQKFIGWVAVIFVVLQVAICVFSERVPIYWIVIQITPASALFGALRWSRYYGSLVTDEPDYPAAQTAMTRVMFVWAGVFVLQVVLLMVLGLRVLGIVRL